jgi:hypothetical protein
VERNKEHAAILCGDVRYPCRHFEGRTGAPDRGVRAGHYGVSLTVTLHGRAFRYTAPEAENKIDAPSIIPAEPKVVEPA